MLAAVFAGGVIGAIARAGLSDAWATDPGSWPWATFLVNVLGAAILGWVMARDHDHGPLSIYRHPLLGTGICGALTTFSTLQVELLQMLDSGRDGLALGYISASLVVGLLAAAFATRLSRRWRWRL